MGLEKSIFVQQVRAHLCDISCDGKSATMRQGRPYLWGKESEFVELREVRDHPRSRKSDFFVQQKSKSMRQLVLVV